MFPTWIDYKSLFENIVNYNNVLHKLKRGTENERQMKKFSLNRGRGWGLEQDPLPRKCAEPRADSHSPPVYPQNWQGRHLCHSWVISLVVSIEPCFAHGRTFAANTNYIAVRLRGLINFSSPPIDNFHSQTHVPHTVVHCPSREPHLI